MGYLAAESGSSLLGCILNRVRIDNWVAGGGAAVAEPCAQPQVPRSYVVRPASDSMSGHQDNTPDTGR